MRKAIPKSVKEAVWKRDKGRCVVCWATEGLDYEHHTPLSLGGSDGPENLRLMCKHCHKVKTADDIRRIRKADRQRRFHETGHGYAHKRKKLKSRGFDKTRRRKFDGTVELRG